MDVIFMLFIVIYTGKSDGYYYFAVIYRVYAIFKAFSFCLAEKIDDEEVAEREHMIAIILLL